MSDPHGPFTDRQLHHLCGRSRILDAMLGFESLAASDGYAAEFDATVLKTLRLLTNLPPNDGEGHGPYLARVGAAVVTAAADPPHIRSATAGAASALVACSHAPCGAAQAPRCLDALVSAYFDRVVEEVRANYQLYCTDPGALHFPDAVELTLAHYPADNTFESSRWVAGGHRLRDTDARLESVVRLTLHVEEVDGPSLSAIPYVLFHECVCHAFSGLRPGTRRRPTTDAADPFAEGWMDFIAAELCARVADGVGVAEPNPPWELTARHAEAAKQLSGARANYRLQHLTDAMRRERGARRQGVDAADNFLRWLRQDHGRDPGWDAFMRISLDLNVLRERDSRPMFVARVAEAFRTRNTGPLAALVARYLGGEPATLFLT